jgi:hypothetical protein
MFYNACCTHLPPPLFFALYCKANMPSSADDVGHSIHDLPPVSNTETVTNSFRATDCMYYLDYTHYVMCRMAKVQKAIVVVRTDMNDVSPPTFAASYYTPIFHFSCKASVYVSFITRFYD